MAVTNKHDHPDYRNLLHLEDCDIPELKQLLKNYRIERKKPNDIFVHKLLVKVTNQDFDLLNDKGIVTPNLMAFLLNSLKWIQSADFPVTLGMVHFISPPDSDYLEYDSFKENAYLQYTKYDPEVHEFLGLIIYIKRLERWICTVQQPDYFEGMMTDFADDKRTSPDKLISDIIQLCSESFEIDMTVEDYRVFQFDQKTRYKKTDFGSFIFHYLYKFFASRDTRKTKFIEEELMELGQQRVIWMLLKIRHYELNPDKIQDDIEKLESKKRRALELNDQEMDEMRRAELDRYQNENQMPQFEKYTDKEFRKLKKAFLKKNYNQTHVILEKLDCQLLGYDFESAEKANFITPKLMQFLSVYLDINDKIKLNKGIFFAQINVLSTPDDDYFEYDLLRIDKDSGGKISLEQDSYVVLLIYYKYKWAFALYNFIEKTGTIVDFKMDDNQSFDELVTDLGDIFKVEFNINVDNFTMRPEFQKIKENGDAGTYVIHYLYAWLGLRRINDISFDDKQKKLFNNKIQWLVLKFWEMYRNERKEREKLEKELEQKKKRQIENDEQEKLRKIAEEEEQQLREKIREQRAKELQELRDGGNFMPYNFSMDVKHVERDTKETQTQKEDTWDRQLQDTKIQKIFELKSNKDPVELRSRQQTLFDRQNPQLQNYDNVLDYIKSIDPETLRKKPPIQIEDLDPQSLQSLKDQINPKKPEELQMEEKLFDILEIIENPEKLKQLKGKNSNIGQYVDLIKQALATKKKKQAKKNLVDKVEFSDLWYDQYKSSGKMPVQDVIKQSLKDNQLIKQRMLKKQHDAQLPTSWYFMEMTKRNVDPEYKDILEDLIHNNGKYDQKKNGFNDNIYNNPDNNYISYLKTVPEQKINYSEQFLLHQSPENFYKNRDLLEQVKHQFNNDLKRADFLNTDQNREIYQRHIGMKNGNKFGDEQVQKRGEFLNSALSNHYINNKTSNLYNVSSLQQIGSSIALTRNISQPDITKSAIFQNQSNNKTRPQLSEAERYKQEILDALSLKEQEELKEKHAGNLKYTKKRIQSKAKNANQDNQDIMKMAKAEAYTYNKIKPSLENPVVLRYNIPLYSPELTQIVSQEIVSENVFNFVLFFIEERHKLTSSEKMMLLNYTRIWFLPTQFYEHLENNQPDNTEYQKALQFLDQNKNMLENYDFIFIPIFRGEKKEMSLLIIDFINKIFIYHFIKRSELQYTMNPAQIPEAQQVHYFFEYYAKKKYNINFQGLNFKNIIGTNSRTEVAKRTPFYILKFAMLLTQGNLIFQGITEQQINLFKTNIMQGLQMIGINNNNKIQLLEKIPI